MVHSLVCVVLPLLAPPSKRASSDIFDSDHVGKESLGEETIELLGVEREATSKTRSIGRDSIGKECTEKQKEQTTNESLTEEKKEATLNRRSIGREMGAHLILYVLECASVIIYAAIVYNFVTFEQDHQHAFQTFWDRLGAEYFNIVELKFMHFLALFQIGIPCALLVLILACLFCQCKHPKKVLFMAPEQKQCEDKRENLDFNAESELCKMIDRELKRETYLGDGDTETFCLEKKVTE